ncbi:MAG: hypothetical protein QOI74_3100 [Micromonosporaceae bacterium]|nr:hypothetical protein [Micromonosporaceae bacterium]
MSEYDFDTAYEMLMSAAPFSQSTGSAMLRNFGAGAQLMAGHLRSGGVTAGDGSGDAGAAAQDQAELHARWFDKVAANASDAAEKLDALAAKGNEHQTTAATVKAEFDQAVAADNRPGAAGGQDVAVIHHLQNGAQVMNGAIVDWGSAYSGFKAPAPPAVPAAGGSHGAASGGPSSSPGYDGGSTSGTAHHNSGTGADAGLIAAAGVGVGATGATQVHQGAGGAGSVEVGADGGDFAGWFKDPRTGYYVDPGTGREFDPVTSRWVDPVTGRPFGEVTQYATGLQGLGGASTSGGLLADTTATAGTSVAGLAGAGGSAAGGAGGFAGLFSAGNTVGVAGGYGGMLPPSLSSGSAAAGSLWQQAGRSLAVKSQVAESMLAREQAARSGHAYMPPTQAGAGAGRAGGGRGARPGYLTAESEEAALFSSRTPRRSYLPPTQTGTGTGKDDKKPDTRDRPDWLADDDVFTPDPAPTGVLGE